MSVTTSSWVGPKTKSRSCRSLMRSSSLPYRTQRPDSCQSSAGWMAGMESSEEWMASSSRRTIVINFCRLRQPNGR